MKKLILLSSCAMLLLASACGEEYKTKVSVRAANYLPATIELVWFDGEGNVGGQTIELKDGRGSAIIDRPVGEKIALVSQDKSNAIAVEGGEIPGPNLNFYVEEGDIEIVFDNNEWPAATIEGGRLNGDLNRYWALMGPLERRSFGSTRKMIDMMTAGEEMGPDPEAIEINEAQEKVRADFISGNPDSELSLELLKGELIAMGVDEFESHYLLLSERVRNTPEGIATAEDIAKAKTLAVGNPAPLFTKTDSKGNKISLADHRGKWVLLDFWGTWCGPCRASHPHLVELHGKYSPEGLVFINIAMESGSDAEWREIWIKAIEDDGLAWTNIADNEFPEEGSIVDDYQVSAFPTKVLIDPEGALAGVFVGGDVDEKLVEIFGK